MLQPDWLGGDAKQANSFAAGFTWPKQQAGSKCGSFAAQMQANTVISS